MQITLQSGAVRSEVSLRAAIMKRCRQRCVFMTHDDAFRALDAYSHAATRPAAIEEIRVQMDGYGISKQDLLS